MSLCTRLSFLGLVNYKKDHGASTYFTKVVLTNAEHLAIVPLISWTKVTEELVLANVVIHYPGDTCSLDLC